MPRSAKIRASVKGLARRVIQRLPDSALRAVAEEQDARIRRSDRDAIWAAVRPYTMTSPQRVATLCDAVRYVVRAGIPGDFVECGVWRGGSSMAMALTLMELGEVRHLHLFDTFAGMTAPSEHDRLLSGTRAADLLADPLHAADVLCYADLPDVRSNMASTGYPADFIHFIEGSVLDTLPGAAPDQIALLRLDTDFYDSTKIELETLEPRVPAGGILIVDDYDHWQGSRKAVDEYFADRPRLFQPIDGGARLAVMR